MARTNMNIPDDVDREMRHEAVDLGLRYPGEFVQHLWKQYKKYKEVEKMKEVFIKMREKEFWQNECKCGEKMYITDVDMAEGIFWKSCPKYMDGDNNHDSFSASIIPDDDGDLYGDFYKALEIIVGNEIDYEGKGEDRDWLTNELLNVKSIGELEMNMARLNTNWKNFFVGENCKEFQKWYQEFVADGGNTLLELPLENSDDKFARKLGFTDYYDLCEKSEIVYEEPGDITWYVTELPDGRWAAWDDAEISPHRVMYFDSRDEAVAFQQSGIEIVEREGGWKND